MARITQYIADNPAQWSTDSENPKSIKTLHMDLVGLLPNQASELPGLSCFTP